MLSSRTLLLAGIVITFLGLSLAFNFATPLYEGFDEPDHVQYMLHVERTGRIPVLPTELF